MDDAAVQAMMAEACLGVRSDEEFARDLEGFLARHGVDPEDAQAICAAPPRLAIYRRLVRGNLLGVITKMMPRARARLNALAGGAFDATFDEFLATVAPRTHYLREVPGEFLAWAAPRWRARPDVPRYIADLAEHELGEFDVAAVPAPPASAPVGELSLDRPLVFDVAKQLKSYAFAVHELSEDPGDLRPPEERPLRLLLFRDVEHGVRWIELGDLQARVLEALFAGEPLGQAVRRACADAGAEPDPETLRGISELLATLGEHGVLRGAASSP